MGRDPLEQNTFRHTRPHRITFTAPLSVRIKDNSYELFGPTDQKWFLKGAEIVRLMAEARIYYGVKGDQSAMLTDARVFG